MKLVLRDASFYQFVQDLKQQKTSKVKFTYLQDTNQVEIMLADQSIYYFDVVFDSADREQLAVLSGDRT